VVAKSVAVAARMVETSRTWMVPAGRRLERDYFCRMRSKKARALGSRDCPSQNIA
jgi:hypothetical protein